MGDILTFSFFLDCFPVYFFVFLLRLGHSFSQVAAKACPPGSESACVAGNQSACPEIKYDAPAPGACILKLSYFSSGTRG